MKILVSAESFGYGPITTGLNIVKELKKYNDFYITKTLITAYTDAYHLKNNSEEFLKILNNFFNKVKDIFKNNEEDIMSLFNNEQKIQLDMLLKDKKLFYNLLEEKNDVK